MSIKVACSACQHRFAVADKFAGKSGKCPKCGGIIRIPEAMGSAPSSPAVSVPSAQQPAIAAAPSEDEFPDYTSAPPRPRAGAVQAKSPGKVAAKAAAGKRTTKSAAVPMHVWYGVGAVAVLLLVGGGFLLMGNSSPTSGAKSQASAKKSPGKQSGGKQQKAESETIKASAADSFPDLPSKGSQPNSSDAGGFKLADGLGERPKQPAAGAPLQEVYAYVERGIVLIEVFDEAGRKIGLGSGFVIDASGLVATNYHVVDSASRAQAVFNDGFHAEVNGYAAVRPEEDLAILKLTKTPRNMVVLDIEYKDQPRKLEEVVAIGHPHDHQFAPFDGRVSRVVHTSELPGDARQFLRSLGGRVDHLWIEHKTGIAPGNSGGPLIDHRGHVLGINTWVNQELDLGYALSVQHIRTLRANLLPKQTPLADLRRKRARDDEPERRDVGLTVNKLRAMYDTCAGKKWFPQSNQDYRELQMLAQAITFAKWADERSNPADVDADALEALAKEADSILADMAKIDWSDFQHVSEVNRYAAKAIGATGSGVYVFATVEKTFPADDGRPGAILSVPGGADQDGTDIKVFVELERNSPKLSAGMQCMMLGVKFDTTAYGDNPLAKKQQHVVVTKCVVPY